MTKTRMMTFLPLVAVLLVCSIIVVSVIFSGTKGSVGRAAVYDDIYHDAESTLIGYLGMGDDAPKNLADKGGLSNNARMTQRVTVVSGEWVLPISGTITKVHDAYYPGTYELKFSNKAVLTNEALVKVSIKVKAGDVVYILTGNRDGGYREYKEVRALEDNMVEFETGVIQDYTISTTDIVRAQEAMASVLASH